MLQVVGLVAPLFALMALGYGAGKIARLPLEGLAWLNFFVIYVALPAMFFKLLSQTDLSQFAGFEFIALTTLATLFIFILSFTIAGIRSAKNTGSLNIAQATIQGFAGAYGNVGYMGPPLALAAFGPAAIGPAALIFSFDNALHFTLAPLLMALDKQRGSKRIAVFKLALTIAWKILSHPFILATIAGFTAAYFSFVPNSSIASVLDMLAAAAPPCALFMMGVSAALRPLKRVPVALFYLVPIKLVLHPLLVYAMLVLYGGFTPVLVHTAVLLAALPSAANVFVIAEQYQVWQERASSAVIISTLLSILSLSAIIFYFRP